LRGLLLGTGIALFSVIAMGQEAGSAGARCRELARVSLPHAKIEKADVTEAGKLAIEGVKEELFARLPAFCRVIAESHPSSDSKIAIEAWLPMEGWNQRFLGVGNGGFAGEIDYRHLAVALLRGYATAGTDTGHKGNPADGAWALGHKEKIADFGYRGVHEMTLSGEAIVKAFYGRAAGHRYFAACSDGGREALMEAQRFPNDYDGILAGAPAYNWTHLAYRFLTAVQALENDPASYIPAAKLPAISKAVVAQCGTNGDADVLDDPRQCRFDPEKLKCDGADTAECLTAPQVTALQALYAEARLKDGTGVNPGWLPGGEMGHDGWAPWILGPAPGKSLIWLFTTGYFTNMVYNQAGLDAHRLDPDEAFALSIRNTSKQLDAVDADLSQFRARGGKLILFHGWDDPAIPAPATIDYFDRVNKAAGDSASSFTRLFMIPGMQHCADGPGATSFGQDGPSEIDGFDDAGHNLYHALEIWTEQGTPPGEVIASRVELQDGKPNVVFTRPLCAYPQRAVYSGTGDRSSAASWTCSAAKARLGRRHGSGNHG